MVSTDKLNCNILADLLVAHGIRNVVASPGSRNAPLLTALSVREELKLDMVIDERSAAFIALGMAVRSGEPVAIVCTSGTAVLNYAPAVAEAYYRAVPLIVISADRPAEWIDQDDSQTIRQPGCLSSIVKSDYDIPARLPHPDDRWLANRQINDAISLAVTPRRGPVHINIRIDAPLGNLAEYTPDSQRVITTTSTSSAPDDAVMESLAKKTAASQKVMILAGFLPPETALNGAINRLSALPNVTVLTETVANLHGERFIPAIDLTLSAQSKEQLTGLRPELVITLGGALVSRKIKEYLRSVPGLEHWHVGPTNHFVDCFRKLTLSVDCQPEAFFTRLASRLSEPNRSDYADKWAEAYRRGLSSHDRYIESIGWSDMKAFDTILSTIPAETELQISNGTPIRYSQLFGFRSFRRVDCNRGVSGIDGSTSTALGASVINESTTLLISGDMSFQYDLQALSSRLLSHRLKMIVICNSGGGIFRFVESTAKMEKREFFFSECMNLPLRQITEAYDIAYFEATDDATLQKNLDAMLAVNDRPTILAVVTPPEESAAILRNYFLRR